MGRERRWPKCERGGIVAELPRQALAFVEARIGMGCSRTGLFCRCDGQALRCAEHRIRRLRTEVLTYDFNQLVTILQFWIGRNPIWRIGRVRPGFEPSALAAATFSLQRSSALIERLRLPREAHRQFLETSHKRSANVDGRPIIDRANISPTNGIEPRRSRRARIGAHYLIGYIACRNRAGAYDLTAAHRSPQRGSLSSCAGETKATVALSVRAAFACINS
jgi:hypothetical protein